MTDPFLELLDDAAHADAVADRARRRMIAEADDHDSTFAGSLSALAQAGTVVLLDTSVGRTVRGRLDAVTDAHVVVGDRHATSYVRIDQITTVRAVAGAPRLRLSSPEAVPSHAAISDHLVELAHEHTAVDAHLVGGATVRGDLRLAGADVLTLRTPATRSDALVQLGLVAILTVQHCAR